MNLSISKKWLLLGVAAVGILLFIYTLTNQAEETENIPPPILKEKEEEDFKAPGFVMVDVKGAVAKEGVYELPQGARVIDAIAKAGGFLEKADKAKVNLASLARDEMVIYVPVQGELQEAGVVPPSVSGEGKIAINQATAEQLQEIPGVGPSKAANIIRYREEQGAFQKLEDLLEVDGIGEKSLEKMKDYIIVP
ncbi:helix-hairpin-helix domain-containing protein [Bacillus sp. 165]|uniref:helix-hairpin-helix domain-containing protein n=1 Tax=Bacillus sp. 165 TaxID=1529117 RepID=UPI001ADC6122|nr:helix-hairpin-helix domain-containing protein [Bacillus sp. 165]MBO9129575.1 helix-hairpin-helix domain-containing protein [Bacillus sp. 165]